jgi:hypothetical protein
MDDDVGLRGCDRLRKRVAVENVNHDWHNPQRAQHPAFGGCARRAGNLMHGFVQQTRRAVARRHPSHLPGKLAFCASMR